MNENEHNRRIAQTVHRDCAWNGQTLRQGDFVALLDGQIVAVENNPDAAIAALRTLDPNPMRGMVVAVAPSVVDVIRREL